MDLPGDPGGRRLRFRSRAMMVLALVLGGGLGWVVHRARIRRDVERAVERAGGNVLPVGVDVRPVRAVGLRPALVEAAR